MVRETLKLKNKDAADVAAVLDAAPELAALAAALAAGQLALAAGADRVRVAVALRKLKALWPAAVDVACVLELCRTPGVVPAATADLAAPAPSAYPNLGAADLSGPAPRAVVAKHAALVDAVVAAGLDRVWEAKPRIDGRALAARMGIQPGKRIGALLRAQADWQVAHPSGTDDELLAHLGTVPE